MADVAPIIEYLNETLESEMPKSVHEKVERVIKLLSENSSLSISKALQELEALSEDGAVDAHTRTQLWSVVSMLEAL